MTRPTMKHGDCVTVLNGQKGRVIVEGEATFLCLVDPCLVDGDPDFALVRFGDDDMTCQRYIDPNAQNVTAAELKAYVEHLNELIGR